MIHLSVFDPIYLSSDKCDSGSEENQREIVISMAFIMTSLLDWPRASGTSDCLRSTAMHIL